MYVYKMKYKILVLLEISNYQNLLQIYHKFKYSFNLNLLVEPPHGKKPTICIGENKGADQLRSYCTDSTILLLSKSKISSI